MTEENTDIPNKIYLKQSKDNEVESPILCSPSESSCSSIKIPENFEEILEEDIKMIEKSNSIKEEIIEIAEKNEDLNIPALLNTYSPKEINDPIFTPELRVDDNKILGINEKRLPVLEISPIKSMMSVDDYSDIVAALASPVREKIQFSRIPDLFIKATKKTKQLPLLKPSTPYYFSKTSCIAKMRKENKVFIDKLN